MKQRQIGKQGRGNGKKEKASVAETEAGKGKEDHKAEIFKKSLKSTEGHSEVLKEAVKIWNYLEFLFL